MTKSLAIGDMARHTGTKVNTIRFYEDIGLLPRAARTPSGRRIYDASDLQRLAFVRHGRGLGFSVEEVRSLLAVADRPEGDCAEVSAIARRHLESIDARIAKLASLRGALETVVTTCEGGKVADCRIIETIAGLDLVHPICSASSVGQA